MSQSSDSVWQRYLNFLQNKVSYTRKEVHESLRVPLTRRTTIDCYRVYLQKAGYLKTIVNRSNKSPRNDNRTNILKPIPTNLTLKYEGPRITGVGFKCTEEEISEIKRMSRLKIKHVSAQSRKLGQLRKLEKQRARVNELQVRAAIPELFAGLKVS